MTPQMRILITADNKTRPAMQQVVDDAQKTGTAVNSSMTLAGGGVANLASQFNDIGVMLASGQSPLILAIQQGTQISQVIGPMGAAGAAKALGSALASIVSPVSLLTIGVIAVGAATAQWLMALVSGGDDAKKTMAELAAPLDTVRGQIGELKNITDAYAKAVKDGADGQKLATDSIVANSEREFNAKKSLLELELKRQQAAIAASRAELEIAGRDLRKEVAQGTLGAGVANDVAGGFADPKIGQFVRSPSQDMLLQRTSELIESSPLNDKMTELRANIELTEIATSGLEEALGLTFQEGVSESVADLAGKTKAAKENFGAFLELVDEGQAVFEATRTPFEVLGAEIGRLDQLLAMGVISWDTYHRAVNRATMGAAEDTLSSLSQITGALSGAFEDNKAFAAANIVVNTAQGIMKALGTEGPLGWASAAAIGLAGAAQLSAVLSAQPGGSSAPSVSGAAGSTPAAAASPAPGKTVNLSIYGDSHSSRSVGSMLEQLQAELGDKGLTLAVNYK